MTFWFSAAELAASLSLGTWQNPDGERPSWTQMDWRLLSQHRLHAEQE
jgi:hypothetical protein